MTTAFDEIRKHIAHCDEVSEPFGAGAQCQQALPILQALEAQAVLPPNKLTQHEHDVWLTAYRDAVIVERVAMRLLGDKANHAELAANDALDAYRKKCAAPFPILDTGPHPKDSDEVV